jgi:NAD(P)-dependent dehydrogenase (short-subunit alcohol dehydrogenase family)
MQYNITVNAYAPGLIDTPLTRSPHDEALGGRCAGLKKLLRTPDITVGEPEDIANVVSFFVSENSKFITGQTTNICGGYLYD